jgi:ubiquinone/menaquinone biosynthesis C-methylase UbiE
MSLNILTNHVVCPICNKNVTNVYSTGYDYEYDSCSNQFTFSHCEQCDIIFLNPRPDLSVLSTIYPANYEPYTFHKKHVSFIIRNYLESRKAIKLTKNLNNNAKIMDVGCGGTIFLDHLSKIKDKNFELWGNDFDISICERIANSGYHAVSGRFEDISLDNNYFDMIILKQLIEHIDNPIAMLEKSYNLLSSGGTLVIETPNRDAWDASMFQKEYWGGYDFPRHWTIFNPKSISNIAEKVGFQVENIEFIFSPAFWILSFRTLLRFKKYAPKFLVKIINTRNIPLLFFVCAIDLMQKLVSKKTSNMRITLKKR